MTASPIIIPVARFFTVSGGAALAGGKVYTYESGTVTPKASFTDFGAATPNTNPVILDSAGEADIWLDGNYTINLEDSLGVQQANYPVDNVASVSSGGASEYAVTTGSANAYILTPAPAIVAYDAGTTFNIKINAGNTAPSTINVSNLGTQALVVKENFPLEGGELITDIIYTIVYDGTNFQVQNPTPPIEITMGLTATAPWGKLPMNGTVTVAKTSGGTFNSAIYARVYTYLYDNYSDSVAPVAGGRGASAAADFAANKTITIPDHADFVMMGISAAGNITAAGATAGADTVAAAGTNGVTGSHTLTTGQVPSLTYTASLSSAVNSPTGVRISNSGATNSAETSTTSTAITDNAGGGSHTHTGSTFTGSATSVVQPSRGIYFYISY